MEGIKSSDSNAPIVLRSDGTCALELDRTIFSTDAVLRAAYKFTDRAHVFIQSRSAERLIIVFKPKREQALASLAGDFANELIDQQLRDRLERQFGSVRSLIVAQAFSEGNLLRAVEGEDDYINDPRGIGRTRP